jgi:hypothetical protein
MVRSSEEYLGALFFVLSVKITILNCYPASKVTLLGGATST